jgi:hypothetical protein
MKGLHEVVHRDEQAQGFNARIPFPFARLCDALLHVNLLYSESYVKSFCSVWGRDSALPLSVFEYVFRVLYAFLPVPKPKDKLPPEQTSGVIYKICCCDFAYYGQTDRALKTRIKEHERAVSQFDQYSKVAKHVEYIYIYSQSLGNCMFLLQ